MNSEDRLPEASVKYSVLLRDRRWFYSPGEYEFEAWPRVKTGLRLLCLVVR
jgi:hypothetical protein